MLNRDELKEKVARGLTEAMGEAADSQACRFDPATGDYKGTGPLWRENLPLAEAALSAIEEAGLAVVPASITQDALRYRWLRDGNAYAPEESLVTGGEDLDRLCDEGMIEAGRVR